MSIPILGQRPPMLAGLRADVASGLKQSIKGLMTHVLGDQMLHAEVVAAGKWTFRAAFIKDLGPAWGNARQECGDLGDVVYAFFVEQWHKRYPEIEPRDWLDKVEVKAPPTEAEIEDAWEVEIGSSDSAMRQMYEGSARTRKGRDLGERKGRMVKPS